MQRPTARLLQITFGGPETDLHPKTDMSKQDFAMAMASLRSGAPSSNPRIPPYSCNSQAGCATWTWRHVILFPNSRSEEHTSELQSLMRISYAVFCLKKKN